MGQFPAWTHNYFSAAILPSISSQVIQSWKLFYHLKTYSGPREGMLNFITDTDLATFTIKLGTL